MKISLIAAGVLSTMMLSTPVFATPASIDQVKKAYNTINVGMQKIEEILNKPDGIKSFSDFAGVAKAIPLNNLNDQSTPDQIIASVAEAFMGLNVGAVDAWKDRPLSIAVQDEDGTKTLTFKIQERFSHADPSFSAVVSGVDFYPCRPGGASGARCSACTEGARPDQGRNRGVRRHAFGETRDRRAVWGSEKQFTVLGRGDRQAGRGALREHP